jgi:hypothetical protein
VTFESEGAELQDWFYAPDSPPPWPTVIMAHRFSATKPMVNPWMQARGYPDAISFATGLDDVDPSRIVVWGDSRSGGVALVVAAVDDRIAALVAQAPSTGREFPAEDPGGSLCETMKETVCSGAIEPAADEIDGPMPVVSDDQRARPSALKPETAFRWFNGYGTRDGNGWKKEITRARPTTPVE